MGAPELSVVIIGRNEGARLAGCLRSVLEMEKPAGGIEIIYVDSASTDDSVALAHSMGALVIPVKPGRLTAALGRNAGWRRASAPFVLFLDADTVLDERFVANSLPDLQDEQIAIVWGHRREINTEVSLYNRVLDLDWISAPGFTDYCGGDALMRRIALEQVGGYDETLIAGEEPEMCRRIRALGYKILHADRAMTGHDLAMTKWQQYWKRATRTGYAYAEVSERFRNSGMPFWEKEARGNRIRAGVLLAAPTAALAASAGFQSFWPLVLAVMFLAGLTVRTAWKTRWKSKNPITRLLYGIHSHLQQIPILLGQMQYARDRRSGTTRGLIEYKDVVS